MDEKKSSAPTCVNTAAISKIPDRGLARLLREYVTKAIAQPLADSSTEAIHPLARFAPQIPSVSCWVDTSRERWAEAEIRVAWVSESGVPDTVLETAAARLLLAYKKQIGPASEHPVETLKFSLQRTHNQRFVCVDLGAVARGMSRSGRIRRGVSLVSATPPRFRYSQHTYALMIRVRRKQPQRQLSVVVPEPSGARKRKRVGRTTPDPKQRRQKSPPRKRARVDL